MNLPDYIARLPVITLYDPLAEVLGAAEDGLIDYSFADAVKLAGHACPTVAGAWLAVACGLEALYGDATPVRGDIAVALPEAVDEGVAGVIASVATLLTGAAAAGGFKGLGGQYGRRNLLSFGVREVAGIRLTRRDTGAAVDCVARLHKVAGDPRLGELLPNVILGTASAEESHLFRTLWQDRVERILTADRNEIVEISRINGAGRDEN